MAAVFQSQFAYNNTPTGSILLNANRGVRPQFPPGRLPSVASSNSVSSVSSDSSLSDAKSSKQKIRFAPLPDPRRAVLIKDNGEELPLADDATNTIDMDLQAVAATPKNTSVLSQPSFTEEPDVSPDPSVDAHSKSSDSDSNIVLPPTPTRKSKSIVKSIFRPFSRPKRARSAPLASDQSDGGYPSAASSRASSICSSSSPMSSGLNISTEEILTLGTINLFRTSSRTSTISGSKKRSSSKDGSWGAPLGRWASAGSYVGGSSKSRNDSWGAPLGRSQSSSSDTRGAALHKTMSNSSTGKVRKGTRMLNGRVYGGANKHGSSNVNPFANARDTEPEFVEWGNGGMGAVPNGAGKFKGQDDEIASRYANLQTSGISIGATDASGTDADDGDDGSGMGWVKRRREAREREKAEREAREKQEAETSPSTPRTQSRTNSLDVPAIVVQGSTPPAHLATFDHTAPSTPANECPPKEKDADHVLTAIKIPAPPKHRRNISTSAGNLGSSPAGSQTNVPSTVSTPGVSEPLQPPLQRLQSSDESDDEDEEDQRDDEDDDDDEDEDEEEQNRITAASAGVEKISRHKETTA